MRHKGIKLEKNCRLCKKMIKGKQIGDYCSQCKLGGRRIVNELTQKTEREKMNRQEFFKDKGLLFFILFLEVISFYLWIVFYSETQFFLVPTALFAILGLFELWFIQTKLESIDKTEREK